MKPSLILLAVATVGLVLGGSTSPVSGLTPPGLQHFVDKLATPVLVGESFDCAPLGKRLRRGFMPPTLKGLYASYPPLLQYRLARDDGLRRLGRGAVHGGEPEPRLGLRDHSAQVKSCQLARDEVMVRREAAS